VLREWHSKGKFIKSKNRGKIIILEQNEGTNAGAPNIKGHSTHRVRAVFSQFFTPLHNSAAVSEVSGMLLNVYPSTKQRAHS